MALTTTTNQLNQPGEIFMNHTAQQLPPSQLATTVQAIIETEQSLASILAQAAEGLLRIQASAFAAGLNENLSALAPKPMPQSPAHWVWQVPNLMQQKARRRAGHWQDAYLILAHSQQQMLEWTTQSLLGNVSQAATGLSKINGVFFSRRASAQVINFPDRRESQASQPSSLDVRQQDAQRLARRAAA